jgi:hypothetical protein
MLALKTAGIALLSIPLLLLGLVASTGLLVVEVKTADGPRLVIPVPLFLARAAIGFAPQDAIEVEVPELAEYAEVASRLLAELEQCDDAVLVEVEDGKDRVLIEKLGDEIAIEVTSDDEEVSVHLPLAAAAAVLESYDGGRLHAAGLLDALSASSSFTGTDLVHVKNGEEEVRIRAW